MNEYNNNDNAFYLAVSNDGTALIAKRARTPEVVSKNPSRGANIPTAKSWTAFQDGSPIPQEIGVALTW